MALPRKEIMIVEDDDHIAQLLVFMLGREGYETRRAAEGLDALEMIERNENPPSLILLDMMLPYLDGFQLLDAIRAREGWESVPVIVLTAKSQESDIVRALEKGATDYIVKPFQPMELLARVRLLLKARK